MFLLKEPAFGIECMNVDIFARKHATGLLIRALDERMCLCILKFKTPYDKTAPATPNHNVSPLLNTTCYAAGRNSRIRKPRREGLRFRHLLTASAWNNITSTAKAITQGIKDLTFWKHTPFPSNVVMLMFIFSRHRHHKSASSKPCIPVLQIQVVHKQTSVKVSKAWLRSSYISSTFNRVGYDRIVRVTSRENCLRVPIGIPLSSLREEKCVLVITKGGWMRKIEKTPLKSPLIGGGLLPYGNRKDTAHKLCGLQG